MNSDLQTEQTATADVVITRLIKLGGLILPFLDALVIPPPGISAETWAGAAFMMAGAQGIENFLGRSK